MSANLKKMKMITKSIIVMRNLLKETKRRNELGERYKKR